MEERTQAELALHVKRPLVRVDDAIISRQPDVLAAFTLNITQSGLTDDQISRDLTIDAAQWSRIRRGSAHFPMNKLNRFMDFCGNEAILQYLNWSRGYESLPDRRMSELERELREERIKSQALEQKNALLMEVISGGRK